MNTFNNLRPGKRIRYLLPSGKGRNGPEYKEHTGRVVMVFPHHVVCNGGGRHGIPHVVDANNFVASL